MRRIFSELATSLLAVIVALVLGAVLIEATGYSSLVAYSALFMGAFGDSHAIAQTLAKAAPLIFTGLAVALAFRGGLFNIGGEGQLLVGGLSAALVGIYVHAPSFIHIFIAIAAGMVAGGVWGAIPGFLKARFGAHEVITTIMMNYIGSLLCSYLVNYPFKAQGWVAQTVFVSESATLPKLLPKTQLSATLLLALLFSFLVYIFLWKTTWGYKIRAVGFSPPASEYGGINPARMMVLSMVLSGMLAGAGGAGEVLGVHRRFIDRFSPGYGFDGIAVAVLGRNHPAGVVLAALLFGALRAGGMAMDRISDVPADLVLVIQALVILLVSAPEMARLLRRMK